MARKDRRGRVRREKKMGTAITPREIQADQMVKELIAWRRKNNLSQLQAAEAMEARGVPIRKTTIQQWEQARFRPSRLAVAALGNFFSKHAVITDATPHGRQSKLSQADLAEIRRLGAPGSAKLSMKAIGHRFGVSEGYISRIVRGERLRN
jgi:transcriptional regulator with XRE-family HTH domain